MNEIGIFLFGLVVISIVCAACVLIGWGMITERRDRVETDAHADAMGAQHVTTATGEGGRTQATGPNR